MGNNRFAPDRQIRMTADTRFMIRFVSHIPLRFQYDAALGRARAVSGCLFRGSVLLRTAIPLRSVCLPNTAFHGPLVSSVALHIIETTFNR
jgi:hypothetical protein